MSATGNRVSLYSGHWLCNKHTGSRIKNDHRHDVMNCVNRAVRKTRERDACQTTGLANGV